MRSRIAATALAGVAAFLLAGAAFAAPRVSEAQRIYQQERAACFNGSSNQDRATCLKEAGAAYQEARKGNLTADGSTGANRTARCSTLPAAEREECTLRMQQGTSTGTARDGGILRERTSTVPSR